MRTKKELLFMDIMNIELIRSTVIKKIHSCRDIENLSRTCKLIKYYIDEEKINKKMLCYEDFQSVGSKFKENPSEDVNEEELRYIKFETINDSNKVMSDVRQFPGEPILFKNRIVLYLNDSLESFRENEHELFLKKLIEEVNLNDKLREDAEILELLTHFPGNEYLALDLLRYVTHNKIRIIQIALDAFVSSRDQYRRLNYDIFSGLPQFHELAIYDPSTDEDYNEIMESKEVVEEIIKLLSKRKNATLDLLGLFWETELTDFIIMLFQMATKYKIKIKYRFDNYYLFDNSHNIFSNFLYFNSPISECAGCIVITISCGEQFCNVIENLKLFRNLEKLQIRFGLFDIKEYVTKTGKLNSSNLTLKNCKKLKTIGFESQFTYVDYTVDDQFLSIVCNNLMYLSSLMPSTVERLELSNCWNITKDTTMILSEYMPNIKFIISELVSYKDSDCLSVFSKLQAYISHVNDPIVIPKTVKLLVIGHRDIKDDDRPVAQQLLKNYYQRFSKCLYNTKEEYIFFNNIRCWNIYKKFVQESFHEQYGPYGD
uniref:F-box domain-containing protein n=1 Tax=Strongyloides stercoralis TaxID=6248 RepID=A0A0K0DXG5_STRER